MDLTKKYHHLKKTLAQFDSVVVAFSGGVDSTFLLKVAVEVLGPQKVLALTAISPLYPEFESAQSSRLAELIGAKQQLVKNNELEIPELLANQPRRCYHCKRALFSKFLQLAKENGYQTVLDGSNLDDLDDYRPGQDAIKELQIGSPLLEVGLSKADIRQLSKQLGLPTWDKQSFACLASRFPYGTQITVARLQQIDRCEGWLRKQGFSNYRVRYHEQLARLELPPSDFSRLLDEDLRQQLVTEFKSAGFTYITLDLQGYRTGSMNETLPDKS